MYLRTIRSTIPKINRAWAGLLCGLVWATPLSAWGMEQVAGNLPPIFGVPSGVPEVKPSTPSPADLPTKAPSAIPVSAKTKPSARQDSRIVINIPSRTLWLYQGERIVRYFPVGVGRLGFMTPVGHFKVIRKVEDPGWENPYLAQGKVRIAPGEENPLGTRWIGFHQNKSGEFGIHGTDNPKSVGHFSSHGCVRMKVPDAETLFSMVDVGTPVDVVYQPVLIRRQDNRIRVIVYADRFGRGIPTEDEVTADILKQYPGAQVDTAQLHAALIAPTERPQDVATWTPPESDTVSQTAVRTP